MDGAKSDVQLIYSSVDLDIGTWGDIIVTVFKRSGERSAIGRAASELLRFAIPRPRGVVMITIIKETAEFPSPETHKLMSNTMKNVTVLASATIMEGRGFRAAAVRGAISTLELILARGYPQKVFSRVEEANVWLCVTMSNTKHNWKITPNQLESAIKELAAQFKS